MNSMAKTIAFWVALLVTAVLLYQVFTRPQNTKETEINFSKFMEENRELRELMDRVMEKRMAHPRFITSNRWVLQLMSKEQRGLVLHMADEYLSIGEYKAPCLPPLSPAQR